MVLMTISAVSGELYPWLKSRFNMVSGWFVIIDSPNHDQGVYPMTRFNFMTFDAKLSASQRSIEVHPREMLGNGGLKPEDKDSDRLYQEWKDGYGWKRETPLKSERMHIP